MSNREHESVDLSPEVGAQKTDQVIPASLWSDIPQQVEQEKPKQGRSRKQRREEKEPVGILLSEVEPEKVHWLWEGRLALGKITLIDGDPGTGKSLMSLDFAARVSSGQSFPDGSPCSVGGVVLATPEDGLSDTIVPRLKRAGANLERIKSLYVPSQTGMSSRKPFHLPGGLAQLEQAIHDVEAKLVILDPIMALIGCGKGKDVYKDTEMRVILDALQRVLESTNTACLITRHLTKGGGKNLLYRGSGSIAFIAHARIGFFVLPDQEDHTKRLLLPNKSNLGKPAPAYRFSIASDEGQGEDAAPYVCWEEAFEFSPDERGESSSKGKQGKSRQCILDLLQRRYPEGVEWSTIADETGLPPATVRSTLFRMVADVQVLNPGRGIYKALEGMPLDEQERGIVESILIHVS